MISKKSIFSKRKKIMGKFRTKTSKTFLIVEFILLISTKFITAKYKVKSVEEEKTPRFSKTV